MCIPFLVDSNLSFIWFQQCYLWSCRIHLYYMNGRAPLRALPILVMNILLKVDLISMTMNCLNI